MNKDKELKKINIRKYVNFGLFMIVIILLAIIMMKLYNTYQDNKLGTSVFERLVGNIQYDDIENSTTEMSTDGFILISYNKNEEVKKFENSLQKAVVNNELTSNFYYLNATEIMLEDGYIDNLNKKFNLEGNKQIEALPAILYYKDGNHMKTLTSKKDQLIKVDDFYQMLDSYEITE